MFRQSSLIDFDQNNHCVIFRMTWGWTAWVLGSCMQCGSGFYNLCVHLGCTCTYRVTNPLRDVPIHPPTPLMSPTCPIHPNHSKSFDFAMDEDILVNIAIQLDSTIQHYMAKKGAINLAFFNRTIDDDLVCHSPTLIYSRTNGAHTGNSK